MKKTLVFIFSFAFLLSIGFTKPYEIDYTHSSIGFEAKHLSLSKIGGSFNKFHGEIDINPRTKRIQKLEGVVHTDSIYTNNERRDAKLKEPAFFDSNKFPEGKLVITKQEGDKVWGDLTFKGITKKIELKAEVNGPGMSPMNKKEFFNVELTGTVNRKDFQIGNEFGDAVIGDKISVTIRLEVYEK